MGTNAALPRQRACAKALRSAGSRHGQFMSPFFRKYPNFEHGHWRSEMILPALPGAQTMASIRSLKWKIGTTKGHVPGDRPQTRGRTEQCCDGGT